jgi:hypothetical protein
MGCITRDKSFFLDLSIFLFFTPYAVKMGYFAQNGVNISGLNFFIFKLNFLTTNRTNFVLSKDKTES